MAYRLKYSDYSTTTEGPPDPAAWVGPMGPPGPTGPAGPAGPRTTDIANVLDFGADPTGTNDSSAAFNAAAALVDAHGRRRSVYVPAGFYRINNQINLVNGQSLFGDGRSISEIFCDANFNMSAQALILLNTSTLLLDPGSEIRDISITQAQNTSNTLRSQCVQYPPAISCQVSCGRPKILHCRINGAWTGFTTNGFNVPFYIEDLELGALNVGLSIGLGADGPQDFCHIHALHFWGFGCPSAPFQDGNTVCMAIGRVDGLDCTDISCFQGQINVSSVNSGATMTHFTNLKLDGPQASVTIQGGLQHNIANVYSTAGTDRTRAAVTVNGSTGVLISNWYSHNSSPFPMFDVQAGELSVENAQIRHYALNAPIGQTSNANALLKIGAATVWVGVAGTYTQPLFVQGGGTSRLRIDKLNVDPIGNVNTGTAVSIATDTFGNMVGAASLPSGWTVSVPGSPANTQPYYPAGLSCNNIGVPTQGGITAAGTTSATAFALTAPVSSVVVAAGHGVRLPATALTGSRWVVFNNDGGSAVLVYPATGHSFFGLATDVAISVAAATKLIAIYFGSGTWLREA